MEQALENKNNTMGGCLYFEGCNLSGKAYYEEYDRVDVDCGRSAIQYILETEKKKRIWLPVFNCPLVEKRILKAFPSIQIKYYNIDADFIPVLSESIKDDLFLWVNYYGLMPDYIIDKICGSRYGGGVIIVDNIQGYFTKPREGVYNIYSCRKFVGVPDGAHIIKSNIIKKDLPVYSTADNYYFLLKAYEEGSGLSYSAYQKSEERFTDEKTVYGMPRLTSQLLKTVSYDAIIKRRKGNFMILHQLLKACNQINLNLDITYQSSVPCVYPLLIREHGISVRKELVEQGIYVSTLWKHIISDHKANEFEKKLAENVIPLPIDQRYEEEDMKKLTSIVQRILCNKKL